MLNPELLALLVCPDTHQDLVLATPEEINQLNQAIRGGEVRNAGGKNMEQPVEAALIRTDRAIAYPVRDDIPVMLVPEGIDIRSLNLTVKLKPKTGTKAKAKPKAKAKVMVKPKPVVKVKARKKVSSRG